MNHNFISAWGEGAFIGGGGTDGTIWNGNIAEGKAATIAGGLGNEIKKTGLYASIPGGRENVAQGAYSFAAGYKARALHNGAFVWSDSTGVADSFGDNEFIVHASGGIYLYPASGGCSLTAGGTGWSCSSDRALKENLQAVDTREVLQRVSAMPITRWNSKGQEPSIQHLGPMAQDFYAAFGLGEDDTHISTTDAQGVAFAAIQGLYQVVQEKDAQVASLKSQVATLESRVTALEQAARAQSSPFALPDAASAPLWMLVALAGFAVFQHARGR
jgi:hypothetical protein